jgi:serine acetyltransferase
MNTVRKQERTQFIETLKRNAAMPFWQLLRLDSRRYHGFRRAFSHIGFWLVVSHRISYWLYTHKMDPLAQILQFLTRFVSGCEISRKTVIGPGLSIYHPMGIFVGPYTCMGAVTEIGPQVFIGSNHKPDDPDDYPIILDHVAIRTGAALFGDIIVHDSSEIGANAVMFSDVPANSVVLPAQNRVIKAFR